ncbi:MAG: alpha/beta hydrolase, partial [Nanoarchaeota archaeon]|nr:alpha/beta hydrolase [Nanoarchaeota archaeon]
PQISPITRSIQAQNNQAIKLNFTIANENFQQCDSLCTFYLMDISENTQVWSDNITMKHGEEIFNEFEIITPEFGQGQKIYSFKALCSNIKSTVCLTSSPRRYRTSIVTVNYYLSEEDLISKTLAEENLGVLLSQISSAKAKVTEAEQQIQLLSISKEKNDLKQELTRIKTDLNRIEENSKSLLNSWKKEKYSELEKMDWPEQTAKVKDIINNIAKLNQDISILEELQLENVNLINQASKTSQELLKLNLRLENLETIAQKILESITLLDADTSEYLLNDNLKRNTEIFKNLASNLEEKRLNADFYTLFGNMLLDLKLNESFKYEIYSCDNFQAIYIDLEESNLGQESKDFSEKLRYDALINLEQYLINNSKNESLINITKQMISEMNISNESLTGGLRIDTEPFEDYLEDCDFANHTVIKKLSKINLTQPIHPEINISPENISLPENHPVCCALGDCRPCCDEGCIPPHPIIFLHGHSFNKGTSPQLSMNSFAELQENMDFFINGGELDLNSESEDWGRSNTPITVRASYYYVTNYDIVGMDVSVQKEERIENYAIRLREAIQSLKQKTQADKVNIVAHSMGGLVVREYLSLFGDLDTAKIILINTPNKGVSGRTSQLCSIVGSKRECEDLEAGSVFLNKLNSKELVGDIYAIRSTGCDMDGVQGDGIVFEDSAKLEGAKNYVINGTCTDTLNSNLHTQILNPNLYPELLDLILEILEG